MMKVWSIYLLALGYVLLAYGCKGDKAPEAETSITAETRSEQATAEPTSALHVLVLGNSLAAGYGLDPALSFPALLQKKVDSLAWNVRITNAGVSGETTAGGLARINWLLRDRIDVLILELGGNDGLRGLDPAVTQQNLQGIIDRTRDTYPNVKIILAGMQIPTNLGPTYTEQFRTIFPTLASQNGVSLIPFLLEGVGGNPTLNQSDGIHPTAQGHRIIARTVWQTLEPVLLSLNEEASS